MATQTKKKAPARKKPLKAPKKTARILKLEGDLNVGEFGLLDNVRKNVTRQLPQVDRHDDQDRHLIIAAGGPSLKENFDELREELWKGAALLAVNGAANWLMEQNIRPLMVAILDGLPESVEFVREPILGCKYLLASQAHPDIFEACKDREVLVWHTCATDAEKQVLRKYYDGRFHQILGGSTIGLRALMLARVLGFRFFHIFGMDSCYGSDGGHHAYSQPWNDADKVGKVWCANRIFYCSPWQVSQAQEFQDFIRHHGKAFHLQFYGDGLLAHIVRTGAELINTNLEED